MRAAGLALVLVAYAWGWGADAFVFQVPSRGPLGGGAVGRGAPAGHAKSLGPRLVARRVSPPPISASEEGRTGPPRLKRTRRRRKDEPSQDAQAPVAQELAATLPTVEDIPAPVEDIPAPAATVSGEEDVPELAAVITKGKKVRVDPLADDTVSLGSRASTALQGLSPGGRSGEAEERKRGEVNMDELAADVAAFRHKRAAERPAEEESGGGILSGAKDAISLILTVDFFVVVAFLGWFVVGVGASYGLQQPFLLDKFNELWNPLVMPALTVLMGGTIAGGAFSFVKSAGEERQ